MKRKRVDPHSSGSRRSASTHGSSHRDTFDVHSNEYYRDKIKDKLRLDQPKEVACFSKYRNGDIQYDRSLLKRYTPAKIGSNLCSGLETYQPKVEDPDDPAPLAPLFGALRHFRVPLGTNKSDGQVHQIITFRNNLNKIFATPYNPGKAWRFRVEKHHTRLIFDVQSLEPPPPPPQSASSTLGSPTWNEKCCFAGRRYETLSTVDPDQGEPRRTENGEEEYCAVFQTKLGAFDLVIGAEIDAVDAHSKEYVELKTFRSLETSKDRYVFERHKLLSFWIQSYIVGVPRVRCGFRHNETFRLEKQQVFQTTKLPRYSSEYWDPQVCLYFADQVFHWLASVVTEDQRVYTVHYEPQRHQVSLNPSIDAKKKTLVTSEETRHYLTL